VAYHVLYHVFEDYLLDPRVVRRTVDVSPLATIVAVLLGGSLLGVTGALIAVPAAAAVQLLLTEVLNPQRDTASAPNGRHQPTRHTPPGASPRHSEPASPAKQSGASGATEPPEQPIPSPALGKATPSRDQLVTATGPRGTVTGCNAGNSGPAYATRLTPGWGCAGCASGRPTTPRWPRSPGRTRRTAAPPGNPNTPPGQPQDRRRTSPRQ